MAKTRAKTMPGKRRKAAAVMREFASGDLRSGTGKKGQRGAKVTNPAQAKAIAMSEAGLARPKRARKKAAVKRRSKA